jgi:hypothetical protein
LYFLLTEQLRLLIDLYLYFKLFGVQLYCSCYPKNIYGERPHEFVLLIVGNNMWDRKKILECEYLVHYDKIFVDFEIIMDYFKKRDLQDYLNNGNKLNESIHLYFKPNSTF